MPENNHARNDGSLEQEKKQQNNKDIEPERDSVKPQEESETNQ